MKRHGLWQFHRAIQGSGLRWWDDEDEQARRRYMYVSGWWLGGGHVQHDYKVWVAVNRCAYRAMRRWGLPNTVKTWNELVDKICKRIDARHQTFKCVFIHPEHARDKTRIQPREFNSPKIRFYLGMVKMRLTQYKQYLESKCAFCTAKKTKTVWLGYGARQSGLSDMYPGKYSFETCDKHYKELSAIMRKANMADEMRKEVNRAKRQLNERKRNESTENHA